MDILGKGLLVMKFQHRDCCSISMYLLSTWKNVLPWKCKFFQQSAKHKANYTLGEWDGIAQDGLILCTPAMRDSLVIFASGASPQPTDKYMVSSVVEVWCSDPLQWGTWCGEWSAPHCWPQRTHKPEGTPSWGQPAAYTESGTLGSKAWPFLPDAGHSDWGHTPQSSQSLCWAALHLTSSEAFSLPFAAADS